MTVKPMPDRTKTRNIRQQVVALMEIHGHRVWADHDQWYAEDEMGESLLALAADHYYLWEGATPYGPTPVIRKYYNLREFFKEAFVEIYLNRDVFAVVKDVVYPSEYQVEQNRLSTSPRGPDAGAPSPQCRALHGRVD